MPRTINLPTFTDKRGSLTTYDPGNSDLPFIPKRAFWIYDVPNGQERANHAHEICEQIIIPLTGEFVIEIDDGNRYYLRSHIGLYIEANHKIKLYDFTKDAICLVLASERYDNKEAMSKSELYQLVEEVRNLLDEDDKAEDILLYIKEVLK